MNKQRTSGLDRGRKMTLAGKTAQCAQNVMDSVKNGGSNWLYNTNYFGKAMRGHIAEMQSLGESLSRVSTWGLLEGQRSV